MKRLLLISGDSESRIGFTRIARRWGDTRLTVTEGGRSGFEAVLKQQPDVVVLDADLPDISSLGLVHDLQGPADLPRAPIVVIGVDSTGTEKDRFLQQGAFCYLTRPLNIEEVERTVLGLMELATLR